MESSSLRVLAIDDNQDTLTSLEAVLHDVLPGCAWLPALSGAQGIALARASNPDVILLDIDMPGMDGFDVCRQLKDDEQLRGIPVVFLAALQTPREHRVRALAVGGEGFLTKPIDEMELAAQVLAMGKISKANRWERDENERSAALVVERTRALEAELAERLRAETALRDSAARLKAVLQTAVDGYFLADMQGRLLDVNDAYCRMSGYEEHELLRMGIADLSVVESADAVMAHLSHIKAKGEDRFESRHRRKDGTAFDVEASVQFKPFDGGAVVVSLRDVTERKRLAAELEERAFFFQESQRAARIGSYRLDFTSEEWVASPVLDEIFGIGHGEHQSIRAWEALIYPDDRERMVRYLSDTVIGDRRPFDQEYRIVRRADGAVRWVHGLGELRVSDDGALQTMIGTVQDITERKAGMEALRASEERTRTITESAHDAIVTTDRDGQVIGWNHGAQIVFGYTAAEMLGHAVARVMPVPEQYRDVRRALVERLRSGGDQGIRDRAVEATGRRKDGREFAVELSLAIWRTSEGSFFTGIIRDISERKRAEQALRESEARFRTIFEQAPLGAAVIDSLSGRFHEVNSRFAEIAGRTGAELGTMDWMSITHPDDVQEDAEHMRRLNAGEFRGLSLIKRYVRPDASIVWIRMTIAPLRHVDPAHPRHLCMIEDITERRAAEAALRESEFRWKFAIEGSGHGLWDWDVPTGKVYFSPRWKSMLGFAEDDIGDTLDEWQRRVHPDDMARVMADISALIEGRTITYRSEHRMRCKDGSWLWVLDRGAVLSRDAAGQALRVIGTHKDQTRQRQAAELLRLEGGALEAAANAILITDATGVIEWANTAFTTYTGYSVQEAVGRTPGDLLRSGGQDRAFYERMWATITAGGVWFGEIVNRRKDGSTYTEEMTITPLKDEAGTVTHFVAVKQDITQRKLLEAQFRQAHKMESVGRLAGGIAHDFNNMLGVILGRTELAMFEVDGAQPLHEHLAEIEQAAKRSAGLTRQLLAFARQGTIAPRSLDLNEIVAEELKMLRRLIGENIHLEWSPDPSLWRVLMDPSQLDQILANLCVNARDAIKDTGRLTIATANDVVEVQFCETHASAVPGDYVRLTVSDTGCGMTTDVLSHLFEPFFTTKAVGEGTGLGLATVYGAVKQGNGFITVASEPGRGTTFAIYLPRYVSAGGDAPATVAAAPARRGHETILLVEDESMLLRLAARVLQESGYVVLAADSPAKAMRLAAEHGGAIDLLLTDVVMPKMNGRDLAAVLAKRYPGLKRLFMSGFAAGSGGMSHVTDDAEHFIAKPFTVESLTVKVRAVLDRAER